MAPTSNDRYTGKVEHINYDTGTARVRISQPNTRPYSANVDLEKLKKYNADFEGAILKIISPQTAEKGLASKIEVLNPEDRPKK